MALRFSEEILVIVKDSKRWLFSDDLKVFGSCPLSKQLAVKIAFNPKTDAFINYRYILDGSKGSNNYMYLDANKNYELLTGFRISSVKGKMVTEVTEGNGDYAKELIKKFYATAVEGKEQVFELYSKILKKDYLVYAYSPKKLFFNIVFKDLSNTNRLKYQKDMQNFLNTLYSIIQSDFTVCEIQNPLSNNNCKTIKIISQNVAKSFDLIDNNTDVGKPFIINKDSVNVSVEKLNTLSNLITDQFSVLANVENYDGKKTKELLIMT